MNKDQAIKTAAKWWADRLKAKRPHSNGDSSAASVFACLFADMGTDTVSDDQLEQFKAEVISEINAFMDRFGDRYVSVGCDYGPDMILSPAAKKVGIKPLNFPFKTHLSIIKKDDVYEVQVYDGYGARPEKLQPCE